MLSESSSMQDMDTVLTVDDISFSSSLRPEGFKRALNEAKIKYLYPFVGETLYAEIQALNKTGFTLDQEYIYMAETYFAVGIFVGGLATASKFSTEGDSHSFSIEGYSESVSGISGRGKVAKNYVMEGYHYLSLAGYNPMKIRRR